MPGRFKPIFWAFALLLAAACAQLLRRSFVGSLFHDGGGGAAPELAGVTDEVGLSKVERVRVVLIDGLGRTHAHALPGYDEVCSTGLDVGLDVGFPTVSLPVQHVLWTGLTQQQSGVLYRIDALPAVPEQAIPARVPGSVAIAESHGSIVGSFGFAYVSSEQGDLGDEQTPAWTAAAFEAAARSAIVSDAPLVFVHVLRVDEAGHAHGAQSQEYARAAAEADQWLADWFVADRRSLVHTRWFVLSDHGHLPGGGHGGAEPDIRIVRACIVGGLPNDLAGDTAFDDRQNNLTREDANHGRPSSRTLHLVDFSRAIADSLGLALEGSCGRALLAALRYPEPDATLPRPGAVRSVVGGMLAALGVVVSLVASRGRGALLPGWFVVAYASVVLIHGVPSLSSPVVYPPLGRDVIVASLAGLAVMIASAGVALRTSNVVRFIVSQLALPAAFCLASAVVCGAVEHAFGLTREPPLEPWFTPHVSVFFTLCVVGCSTLALLIPAMVMAGCRSSR